MTCKMESQMIGLITSLEGEQGWLSRTSSNKAYRKNSIRNIAFFPLRAIPWSWKEIFDLEY